MQSVVGIDFSANPDKTWAAYGNIKRSGDLEITRMETPVEDADVLRMIGEEPVVVAIDVPFGWPDAFVSFVSQYHEGTAVPKVSREDFRFRKTDLFVRDKTGKWPLSVSTDKLGVPAHRLASLVRDRDEFDMPPLHSTGQPTQVIEVYPGATLKSLGLRSSGYKRPSDTEERTEIVRALPSHGLDLPHEIADACIGSDDALDACICALTAQLFLTGSTWAAPDDPVVRKEGWIFIPKMSP